MSKCLIVSDKPLEDYENFFADTLNKLNGVKVQSVCVVVRADDCTYSAHYNADLEDLQVVVGTLQADITHMLVRNNLRQYLDELDEEGCDYEEEEEEGDEDGL